jgi:Pyruvate/2-oxoacid:ferredoxin oxidoreductase delta subunit
MKDDIYLKLREHLNALAGGFPSTESGVELRILRKLFSPADARMAVCLTRQPETPSSIALRCDLDEAEASERLESRARRGLIFRSRRNGEAFYNADQFLYGIVEHQIEATDNEFTEMMSEYHLYLGMAFSLNETPQGRIVPVSSRVDSTPVIATHDQIRALVKDQKSIMVAPCLCRKQQGGLGNACDAPGETCLGFGDVADYYIENGWGRQIDVAETLEILDLSERSGLVLQVANAQDINWACNCCSCCCGILKNIKMLPSPAAFVQSNYVSSMDFEKCDACEVCIERCPMGAVSVVDGTVEISQARCIGCGLCAASCPNAAISLVPKAETVIPPLTWDEALDRILTERGLS